MEIGARIYYEISSGNVILNTGERQGFVYETTVDDDYETFTVLKGRNRDTIGVIQLEYGQYAQDFRESNGYRVNPETKELEFSYPDPGEQPPKPPVYQQPLTEQVAELKEAIADLTLTLAAVMAG